MVRALAFPTEGTKVLIDFEANMRNGINFKLFFKEKKRTTFMAVARVSLILAVTRN